MGKDADLAIFSQHPLSIYGVCVKTIVDGVVRFDRDADPDDMRLSISPDAPLPQPVLSTRETDRCMQDTEWLFETEQQ